MEALHLPCRPCHWDSPASLGGENEGEARKEKAGARDGYSIVLSSTEKPQRAQCPSGQSKEKTLIM